MPAILIALLGYAGVNVARALSLASPAETYAGAAVTSFLAV